MIAPSQIAQMLASRIDQLAVDLLPLGHREGCEWRCGSVAGEPGGSLGVHLTGVKKGVWGDFAAGIGGDALDLVAAVLGCSISDALKWSRRWLGIADGEAALPARPASVSREKDSTSDSWRQSWQRAKPIAGTLAEAYLRKRGLRFSDPTGDVLRFADRHCRRNAEGELEIHPALLALLSDVRSGEPSGTINVYLAADGSDRLRDPKGKTSWGRAAGAAAMLSAFEDPTSGLTICEGVETGIALMMAEVGPVWALGGAGNVAGFPILAGIECLTVGADADQPGQRAAATVVLRWREADREAVTVAPPGGDWAAPREVAT